MNIRKIEPLKNKDEFKKYTEEAQNKNGYKQPIAFGIARVQMSQNDKNKPLQAIYSAVNFKENYGSAAVLLDVLGEHIDFNASEQVVSLNSDFVANALNAFAPFVNEAKGSEHKNVQVLLQLQKYIAQFTFKAVFLFEDSDAKSVESAYLKLHLLSSKKVKPRELNLNGVFGALPNVAWSGNTAYDLQYLRDNEIELKFSDNYPQIDYVDKFPRYLMHIIPEDNVRLLDTSKVRYGAYVSAGTTVMPGASYINFNAGTLGNAMVEGRISSSAIVGANSDVGGGASILGVLSGTDGNPISIGENCLLGANSTCGIPLGDGCIIDGGVAIFAGTKVSLSEAELEKIKQINPQASLTAGIVKAKELSSLHGLHFRQDSQSGAIQIHRSTKEVKLNTALHI